MDSSTAPAGATGKIRRFVSENSATLTVAGVAVLLLGIFYSFKAYTSDKKIKLDSVSYTTEQSLLDAKHAEEDLLARQTLSAFQPPSGSSGTIVQSGMAIIQDTEIVGSAGPDKTPMQLLQQMSGGDPQEEAAITLSDVDLKSTVYPTQAEGPDLSISPSSLDEVSAKAKAARASAPVSYTLFSDGAAYNEFRKKNPASTLPEADFTRQRVAILVSVSNMPNKIFEVLSADSSGKEAVVTYRINPLAAAEEGPDRYAFAVLEKGAKPVRLVQQ